MPVVSVILPVYNAERYLKEAIDSVLTQTFSDFELVLINDGSIDGSEAIIESYHDPRVLYLKNEKNEGLVYSLNRAIALAEGKYIARMDADDRCSPERLAKQKAWLDLHPQTAVVASFSTQIDSNGNEIGFFAPDRMYVTAKEIRKRIPQENCISHPSVMGRSEVFKQNLYAASQPNIEDYDLWLRLLSRNLVIEKIPEPLLFYRIHQSSVTQTKLRQNNFFLKHFHCKRRFLAKQVRTRKLNSFDLCVAKEMLFDLARAAGKWGKQLLRRT